MTSREAAIAAFRLEAVEHAELIRRFQTLWGTALERAFAEAVGGRVGGPGNADVITERGEFEFCSQANTKNAAGEAAQRASGRTIVQVTGTPRRERISGEAFLELHGVKGPKVVAEACAALAAYRARLQAETER